MSRSNLIPKGDWAKCQWATLSFALLQPAHNSNLGQIGNTQQSSLNTDASLEGEWGKRQMFRSKTERKRWWTYMKMRWGMGKTGDEGWWQWLVCFPVFLWSFMAYYNILTGVKTQIINMWEVYTHSGWESPFITWFLKKHYRLVVCWNVLWKTNYIKHKCSFPVQYNLSTLTKKKWKKTFHLFVGWL